MEMNRKWLEDKIQQALDNGASVLGMEKKAGLKQDTIRDFMRGKTQMLRADKLHALQPVLAKYVDGVATMSESKSAKYRAREEVLAKPVRGNRIKIPLYKGTLAAGGGSDEDDGDVIIDDLTFKKDWLEMHIRAPITQLRMVKIRGESMEPTIYDGDVVMVDCSQSMPKQDGVYAIWYDGGAIAKRVDIDAPRKKLKLRSDNPNYPSVDVYDVNDLVVIGRVVWRAGKI